MFSDSKKKKLNLPLVNAHTHAAMTAFRGIAEDIPLKKWLEKNIWPAEKRLVSPSFVKKESQKAILEMKKNGIKAFADMYFFEEEVAKVAKKMKMCAVIGEAILDFPTPSAKCPEESFEITENLLKKYRHDPFIKVAVAPHSIYTVLEKNLLRARELSEKYKAVFHIHLSETKNEYEECLKKKKVTPVAYLDKLGILNERTLLVHCVWITDRDIEIMAKRRVNVVHCPLSNLKLGSGIAPVAKMIRRGINVCLGTDGAASSNRLDIWEAGKVAALIQKGVTLDPRKIPAKTIFEMMTINGLRALGFSKMGDEKIGSIKSKIKNKKDCGLIYHLNSSEIFS
jgi:5-methylthioadenosine/S-adenosylhomocysteine deaminase